MPYRRSHIPNFHALALKVSAAANASLLPLVEKWANVQRGEFAQRIKDQRFASFHKIFYPESGTNLSPIWIKRKKAKGADLRTMIATGHYVASIKVFRRKTPHGIEWRIGFHPLVKARDLDGQTVDILLRDVALIHEHGSGGQHARPHWGPFLNLMKKSAPAVRKKMKKAVGKAVRNAVGSRMIVRIG